MKWQSLFLLTAFASLPSCSEQAADDLAEPSANPASADRTAVSAVAGGIDSLAYPGSQRDGDRYFTTDPIDRVVAWYWDEDRPLRDRGGETWAVSKPERRDGGYLIGVTLVSGEDGRPFYIYLTPRAAGGTEGRIRLITDQELKSGIEP